MKKLSKNKYNFTENDLRYKKAIEKERGGKISDKDFFVYITKAKKFVDDYVVQIKKYFIENPAEAQQTLRQLGHIEELISDQEKYKEVSEIKRLSIADIEKLLIPILENNNYKNLQFSKPEFEKGVKVEFTIQDYKTNRKEYDSRIGLQRIMKQSLSGTNWVLMSEGISYKLGFLQGRIRGVESNEELLKIIEIKDDNKKYETAGKANLF
jgi:hypothetical protein